MKMRVSTAWAVPHARLARRHDAVTITHGHLTMSPEHVQHLLRRGFEVVEIRAATQEDADALLVAILACQLSD